jgi:hypothetical protein
VSEGEDENGRVCEQVQGSGRDRRKQEAVECGLLPLHALNLESRCPHPPPKNTSLTSVLCTPNPFTFTPCTPRIPQV